MSPEQFLILLAQSSDTNADEIFTRILFAFCSIAIIWLSLMGMFIYRGMENRRRKAGGIEPLPPLWTWVYQLVLRAVNPGALPESARLKPKRSDTQPIVAPAWDASMPAPDLDMLMGEFGAPESRLADAAPDDDLSLDFDSIPEPANVIPAAPPPPARVVSDVESAGTVALDHPDSDEPPNPNEPESAVEDESEPEEPVMPPVSSSASPASPAAASPPDAVELLRIWRDVSDGTLILEIRGQRFTSLADLRGTDLERRFINVVKELVALVKSGGGTAPPAPRSQMPSITPAADTADAAPANRVRTDEMPSMAPGDMFRQMGQIALRRKHDLPDDEPEAAPLSIPEQIDALLQKRLQSMPEYRGREIEVQPSLGGLVIIKVDGKFYQGVGEVADEDVRALLQDVVREWENSQ